jgi:hypothetical protein
MVPTTPIPETVDELVTQLTDADRLITEQAERIGMLEAEVAELRMTPAAAAAA